MWVPYNFAPKGWAECKGQILPISQNTALFSLLGTTFGGNGQTTFALPDMQGRTIMGDSADYPTGTTTGEANVTLLSTEIPAHTHVVNAVKVEGTKIFLQEISRQTQKQVIRSIRMLWLIQLCTPHD
jgi:microcystin-dependent protein